MDKNHAKKKYQSPTIIMFNMSPFCQDEATLPLYNGSSDPTLNDPSESDARGNLFEWEEEDETPALPKNINLWK